jgi:hypothetical protein
VAYIVRASPADAGQSLTVSVSGPAVFSDANGTNSDAQQQPLTLDAQSGATFWIRSMGVGETTVSVALPYRLEAGTVYSQLDDKNPTQRLVLAENRDLVATASAQALWSAGVSSPAPTDQATVPGITSSPPVATSPPTTGWPTREEKTPAPTEQPIGTMVVGEAVSATSALVAAVTVLPAPPIVPAANEQAGAAPVEAPAPPAGAVPRPRTLPRTGEPTGSAIGLVLLGLVVLLVGALLRRGWIMQSERDTGQHPH